jgi:hypothetical protein
MDEFNQIYLDEGILNQRKRFHVRNISAQAASEWSQKLG